MQTHTDRHYEEELRRLHEALLHMGRLTEGRVADAVRALVDRDTDLARRVADADQEIDQQQLQIDEHCLRVLALYQPAGSDLRTVVGAIKINWELERIADKAVSIAHQALELIPQPLLKPLEDIPRMADLACTMVHECLEAFVRQDEDLAQAVCRREDELDSLKQTVTRELTERMVQDPGAIDRAMRLILVARHLERIGDHATNVAEDVVLIVRGRDIRHRAAPPTDRPA